MIHVVATIELVEGAREEFLAARRKLLPLVRAEKGCLEYVPTMDIPLSDPPKVPPRQHTIIMIEKWETLPDLQAHAVAPHMSDFRHKSKAWVRSIKVEVFRPV